MMHRGTANEVARPKRRRAALLFAVLAVWMGASILPGASASASTARTFTVNATRTSEIRVTGAVSNPTKGSGSGTVSIQTVPDPPIPDR
jgi:hypothetical protein